MRELSGADLESLARIANDEHRAVAAALNEAVKRGIAAGDALGAARAQLPHGEWLAWLSNHFEASASTARMYIRFAEHRAQLEAAEVTTYERAEKLIKELEAGRVDDEVACRKQARSRRGEGATYSEIAKELGVDEKTAWNWANPERTKAGKEKRRVPVNHLDDFATAVDKARGAAAELGQPKWVTLLEALRKEAQKLARRGHECVCQRPLPDDGSCQRCGKTIAVAA